MRILSALSLFLAACVLGACTFANIGSNDLGVTGSGRLIDKTYPLDDFTRVEVGLGAKFTVTQDSQYSVVVTTDDNLPDYLIVERRGDTLYVGLQDGSYRNCTLRVSVAMPALQGITLSGGTRGSISGFRSLETVKLHGSGGSQLTGDLECESADFTLSGGSRLTLKGASSQLRLDGSGGSPIDLGDFVVAGDADIVLSGGSQATVNMSGRLDADLSGGASLRYAGSPTLGTVNASGGSQIRPR